jgi:hypothetical protein
VDSSSVDGYEHVLDATRVLKAVVDDLFDLPGAAQTRAVARREELGEDHGDDLLCGCWAAATTATATLELAGRHMDAVIHLAADHAGFAPSAAVLARAALESLLRVRWLLDPEDANDREQRWAAVKKEETRFYRNAGFLSDADFNEEIDEIDAVAQHAGGTIVKAIPSVETLARDYGKAPTLYDHFYRFGSQPTHGTLVGAGTFEMDARCGWQALGHEGEWIEAEFWGGPLTACWEGATIALPRYRDLLVPKHELPGLGREADFVAAMRALPANYQAKATAALGVAADRLQSAPQLNRAQRRAAQRARRSK